jgi:CubicO group peptidase (beta-lactamase class C family)
MKKGNETIYEDYLVFADVGKQIGIATIPMASLTKMFMGVLIMQLVEDNKLSLDEPLNKYVSANIPDSIRTQTRHVNTSL